jgi:hypothetical protein
MWNNIFKLQKLITNNNFSSSDTIYVNVLINEFT